MSIEKQADSKSFGQIFLSILTNLLLLFSGLSWGAVLGGLYVKLFVPRTAMGWDGLADALGGLMVGALVGLVASVILIRLLTLRRRLQTTATLLVLLIVVIAGFSIMRERNAEAESTQVVREQAFQPRSAEVFGAERPFAGLILCLLTPYFGDHANSLR